jgi:hypothetical protein
MLEQTVRVVETENTVDGTILRFGPLGNKSHHKQLQKEIQLDAQRIFEMYLTSDKASKTVEITTNEATEIAYSKVYPTLKDMNIEGWKLESFEIIIDSSELRLQVAIFSRELPQ